MPQSLKQLIALLKKIALKIAAFQAALLLAFMYFIVFLPVALLTRLFSDPLRIKPGNRNPAWIPKAEKRRDAAFQARQQF